MTQQKSTRPISNILNSNEESEQSSSSRPQSNISTSLQSSNESVSFDGMSIKVCDEKTVATKTDNK